MLRVGTSGWSYPDWVGPVYPLHLARSPGKWLAEYARRFASVEINSTFYQLPGLRTVEGWVKAGRAVEGFEFSAKVPRAATHEAMAKGDDAKLRSTLDAYRATVRPLRAAQLLGASLLQLAPGFRRGPSGLRMLRLALEELAPEGPVAAEFRHASWLEGDALHQEAVDMLKAHGAANCTIDGPHLPAVFADTAEHAYVRFHGRRADAWHRGGTSRVRDEEVPARYDYLYAECELKPWAERLQREDGKRKVTRVFFNNHPGGKAVRNAEQTQGMLGLPEPQVAASAGKVRGRRARLEDF